jgi:CRP/FNR family cyclic AMP-dependent transcriptional regulator
VANLLELTDHQPRRNLDDGEVLIAQGAPGGDLFVLETGMLGIERDGVNLATVTIPGSVVGEISVLIGTNSSATVKAVGSVKVRVIPDALKVLEAEPQLLLSLAALVANRLEATSFELVGLSHELSNKSGQNALARLASALHISKG